jgi:tetratricopeptide (TPR) repeat protein
MFGRLTSWTRISEVHRVVCFLALGLATASFAKKPAPSDPGLSIEVQRVIEATNLGNLGEREKANKVFTEVLAAHPRNIDARVGRGVNHYLLGNLGSAQTDLGYAFSADAWKEISTTSGGINEVAQHVTTVDLVERRIVGASMLIVLLTRDDSFARASETLEQARETFGDAIQFDAAEARLLLAQGEANVAWKKLSAAVKKDDPTLFVQSVASEMVSEDPGGASKGVTAFLTRMGQWTVHYNQAVGQFRARKYKPCTSAVEEGLRKFPGNEKMLQVGYTCAARSDFALADLWLRELGGPSGADPFMVVAHAEGLVRADRPGDAVKLLEGLPPAAAGADPTYLRSRQILHVRTLTELGRLDDALELADGSTAPEVETPLAYQLMQVHRYRDAQALLERACPNLKDRPTDQRHCLQQLEWARSH